MFVRVNECLCGVGLRAGGGGDVKAIKLLKSDLRVLHYGCSFFYWAYSRNLTGEETRLLFWFSAEGWNTHPVRISLFSAVCRSSTRSYQLEDQ